MLPHFISFDELVSGFYQTPVDDFLGVFYLSVSSDKSQLEYEHSHHKHKHLIEISSPEEKQQFERNYFYKSDISYLLSLPDADFHVPVKTLIRKKLAELEEKSKTA
jgi:hypothetical protein